MQGSRPAAKANIKRAMLHANKPERSAFGTKVSQM